MDQSKTGHVTFTIRSAGDQHMTDWFAGKLGEPGSVRIPMCVHHNPRPPPDPSPESLGSDQVIGARRRLSVSPAGEH